MTLILHDGGQCSFDSQGLPYPPLLPMTETWEWVRVIVIRYRYRMSNLDTTTIDIIMSQNV